jgi:CRP-like cAMP-binding protein
MIIMTTESLENRLQVLSRFALFSGIDEARLLDVAGLIKPVRLKNNSVLFREGNPSKGLYLLVSGKIKLLRFGFEGKEQILLFLLPDQSFAEGSLFDDEQYCATAQAVEDSKLIFIEKDGFSRVLRFDGPLADNLFSLLRRRQKIMAQKVEDLSLLNATSRVCRHLIMFWDRDSNQIVFANTAKQSAQSLGMALETFSRIKRKLKDQGVIRDKSPGVLEVMNSEVLEDLAG